MLKRVLAIMIAAIVLVGCSNNSGNSVTKVKQSSANFKSDLDLNSPEGLAKESSAIYLDMISETITPDKGFERLLDLSSQKSKEMLLSYKKEFEEQIKETIRYMKANDDNIAGFTFAETEYRDKNTANIKRIQKQDNGKEYYFQQDYVKENGVWKIQGDNVINDFKITKNSLFW